jgi:hypothetical protein
MSSSAPPSAPSTAATVAPAVPMTPSAAPVPVVLEERTVHEGKVRTYPYPVATLPGFEMLPDGGSRLFVEISKTVNVEERRSERVLTYILKGTRVVYRNNENSLVTVHFNTPVTRARLLPSGRDLLFSVDLRADASPAWKMVAETDGSATLQVDFAKGSFLPAGDSDVTMYGGARPASAPPPPPSGPPPGQQPKPWHRGGGRGGGAPPPVTGAAPAVSPSNAQPSPN